MGASRDFTASPYLSVSNIANLTDGPQTWIAYANADSVSDRGLFGMLNLYYYCKYITTDIRGAVNGSWDAGFTGVTTSQWDLVSLGWSSGGAGTGRMTYNNQESTQSRTPFNIAFPHYLATIRNDGIQAFDGQVGFFSMYTRYLSTDELLEVSYNPFSVVDGMKLFIPGWSSETTTITDLSGFGNDATEESGSSGVSEDGPPIFLLGGQ